MPDDNAAELRRSIETADSRRVRVEPKVKVESDVFSDTFIEQRDKVVESENPDSSVMEDIGFWTQVVGAIAGSLGLPGPGLAAMSLGGGLKNFSGNPRTRNRRAELSNINFTDVVQATNDNLGAFGGSERLKDSDTIFDTDNTDKQYSDDIYTRITNNEDFDFDDFNELPTAEAKSEWVSGFIGSYVAEKKNSGTDSDYDNSHVRALILQKFEDRNQAVEQNEQNERDFKAEQSRVHRDKIRQQRGAKKDNSEDIQKLLEEDYNSLKNPAGGRRFGFSEAAIFDELKKHYTGSELKKFYRSLEGSDIAPEAVVEEELLNAQENPEEAELENALNDSQADSLHEANNSLYDIMFAPKTGPDDAMEALLKYIEQNSIDPGR